MISLSVEKNIEKTKLLFKENKLEFYQSSACLTAVEGEQLLGFCLFDITKEEIIIRCLVPQNDLLLADGILRSTLHFAAERFILHARYEDDLMTELFQKLGFIKFADQKLLDIDKLFKSCQGCQ